MSGSLKRITEKYSKERTVIALIKIINFIRFITIFELFFFEKNPEKETHTTELRTKKCAIFHFWEVVLFLAELCLCSKLGEDDLHFQE